MTEIKGQREFDPNYVYQGRRIGFVKSVLWAEFVGFYMEAMPNSHIPDSTIAIIALL